jgi:hypothetical protein
VDDLQTAWLIIGWLLAFWAGKDLQSRFAQWRASRRGNETLTRSAHRVD